MGIFKSAQKDVVIAGGGDSGVVGRIGGGQPTIGIGRTDLYVVLGLLTNWVQANNSLHSIYTQLNENIYTNC